MEADILPPRSLPGGAVVKILPTNAGDVGDTGSIPVSGRSPGGGHGSPLPYPCLENPMDRGAWWATIHEVAKTKVRHSWMTENTVFRGSQRRLGSGLVNLHIKGPPWVGTFSSRKGNLSPARKALRCQSIIICRKKKIKCINNPHILVASLMPVRKQGSCGSVITFRVTAVSLTLPSRLAFPSLKPPGGLPLTLHPSVRC